MAMLDGSVMTRVFAITASGVGLGLLFSLGGGLSKLVSKYKREAKDTPTWVLLPALGMACIPVTKLVYAFIVVTILSQRNLSADHLSLFATFAGCAFAFVAVFQGAFAAKLINMPTEKMELCDQRKFAVLGAIETLAIVAQVGIIVFSAKVATGA